MKIYNSERNIKVTEMLKIFLNKKKAKDLLQRWFPNKKIIFTNYGRSAFELILDEYGIRNCKVMIPGFICPLFKPIFKKRNIEPVLIDVDIKTWNISKKTLKKGFDKNAKCLIINNMNGLPAPIKDFKKICKGVIIIEDCAHALGAKHNEKRVGSFGDASFFSFYKNLPTISGGAAILDKYDKKIKQEKVGLQIIKKFFYYIGNNANTYRKIKGKVYFGNNDESFYEPEILSPNKISMKLINYYAFNINGIVEKRKRIAKKMIKDLSSTGVEFQQDVLGEHIYTYFSFLLPKKHDKEKFLNEIQNFGIIPRLIWDNPLSVELKSKNCPVSKEISERVVSIPLNVNYSKKDVGYLIGSIKDSLDIKNIKEKI